ncbi:hypothetical protein HOLleu_42154 [Holothuria leucospilota]|uniref:Uncharacterized protein n=1 Tax=Holothuria leucospilota TaxID=206669 RepID=A0A9Q0YAU1_HOLLE|nr:hypothetical protein HOLleu_42154 [Holothuria leucospilota]
MTQLTDTEVVYLLGLDFIRYKLNLEKSSPFSKYAETLRRVGDEIDQMYEDELIWMVKQLKFDPAWIAKETVYATFDAMFDFYHRP